MMGKLRSEPVHLSDVWLARRKTLSSDSRVFSRNGRGQGLRPFLLFTVARLYRADVGFSATTGPRLRHASVSVTCQKRNSLTAECTALYGNIGVADSFLT